jgi:hypothetical protein
MSFNSHLKKMSVVHSDRPVHTYLKSSDQLSSLYRGEVRSYEVWDNFMTTLSPHNVVMFQGHPYLDPPILGTQAYRDVCTPSVDIPTPRTHTSNSVQRCDPSPTTNL